MASMKSGFSPEQPSSRSLHDSLLRCKVAQVKLHWSFFLRLCRCLSTPSIVVILSLMWCLVVITVSLTLTTHSASGQNYQQRNGVRRLNNIRAFKIPPKQPVQPVQQLKGDMDEDKPLILHRKTHLTERKMFKERLSPSENQYLQEKLVRSFGKNYGRSSSYKRIVRACSEDKKAPGRVYNLNTSPYYWTQSDLCNGNTDLLVAVHTRPTNFANRQLIRDTYGSMKNIHGKRVVVAFFLGNPANPHIQRKISDEARDNR